MMAARNRKALIIEAILIVIASFMLVLAGCVPAMAAEKDYRVSYEGQAKGLVSVATDFFAHFGDLMPGDSITGSVTVSNQGPLPQRLFFRTDPQGNQDLSDAQDLLGRMELSVTSGKKRVYHGPLAGKGLSRGVNLGTYQPGKDAKLDFTVSCPDDLGNSYALSKATVRWVFSTQAEAGETPVPAGYHVPARRTDDGVLLDKTGASTALLTGLAALLAVVGVLLLSRIGRPRPRSLRARSSSAVERLRSQLGFAPPGSLCILLICGAIALTVMSAGGTALALLTDATDATENHLTIGDNTIEVVEEFPDPDPPKPGKAIVKKVQLKNVGPAQCHARVLVSFSSNLAESYAEPDYDRDHWTLREDGYWYYHRILKPGETTEPLFTQVQISPDAAELAQGNDLGFDLAIKAESVAPNPGETAAQAFARMS